MSRAVYEIRAIGEVPQRLLDDFHGASVSVKPAGSTIRVLLRDEAELHGLLDAMSRAGIEIVDMRKGGTIESDRD